MRRSVLLCTSELLSSALSHVFWLVYVDHEAWSGRELFHWSRVVYLYERDVLRCFLSLRFVSFVSLLSDLQGCAGASPTDRLHDLSARDIHRVVLIILHFVTKSLILFFPPVIGLLCDLGSSASLLDRTILLEILYELVFDNLCHLAWSSVLFHEHRLNLEECHPFSRCEFEGIYVLGYDVVYLFVVRHPEVSGVLESLFVVQVYSCDVLGFVLAFLFGFLLLLFLLLIVLLLALEEFFVLLGDELLAGWFRLWLFYGFSFLCRCLSLGWFPLRCRCCLLLFHLRECYR